jgi:hypothetical protein
MSAKGGLFEPEGPSVLILEGMCFKPGRSWAVSAKVSAFNPQAPSLPDKGYGGAFNTAKGKASTWGIRKGGGFACTSAGHSCPGDTFEARRAEPSNRPE